MSSTTRRLERASSRQAQPEEELVERASRYEPEALAEAFDENFDRIYSFVYAGVGDEERAEDMTGEIFVKALDAVATTDAGRARGMTVFLLQVAQSVLGQQLRALSRSVPREELAKLDRVDLARLAIGRLREGQRKVIMLRFFAGMDSQEISDVTGYGVPMVQALQHSALKTIHRFQSQVAQQP